MNKHDRLRKLTSESTMVDLTTLRALEKARYQRYARQAAANERAERYAEAASAWGEAYKSARGANVDWCQSRLSLCLSYASATAAAQRLTTTRQVRG